MHAYTHHASYMHVASLLTLISILPCRLLGLGRVLDSLLRVCPRSSLSPRISLRYWAIFFCCWMLQWFSMDRITGYLEGGRTSTLSHAYTPDRRTLKESLLHFSFSRLSFFFKRPFPLPATNHRMCFYVCLCMHPSLCVCMYAGVHLCVWVSASMCVIYSEG